MFGKAVVRYTVIAGLVGGAAALVAGPDRLGVLVAQTRGKINSEIDKHIEDPIALRAQLKSLEGKYPERIAEVRGDLAELKEQQSQLNRELEISDRVVELSRGDLETMDGMLSHAETLQSANGDHVVRVAFNNESLDLKDAYGKANKIRQVHTAYVSRIADINRDLGYLTQQEQRLTGLLEQLNNEHQEYQAKMWTLDRQVDSIARNDRMIDMMEKRQRTLDEQSRYSAGSLDQVQTRLADIRAKQEAKLEAYAGASNGLNYEDRAKFDLDAKNATKSLEQTPVKPSLYNGRATSRNGPIIEIRPEDLKMLKPVLPNAASPAAGAGSGSDRADQAADATVAGKPLAMNRR